MPRNERKMSIQLYFSLTLLAIAPQLMLIDASENQFNELADSSSSNNSSNNILESMPNFYSNSQASKFRVNVSNICEKNQMRVTIRLNKPFYGLIHAKDRRKKAPCFIEGNGDQSYSLEISFTQVQSDFNYCGVVSHHLSGSILKQLNQSISQQTTLSVVLVVRLHKTIEFSDDRYFLLSCANRCSKPDCSTSSNNQDGRAFYYKGLTTSESIVSPVVRASNEANAKLIDSTMEKCDAMLDLKFQWLLKLCWILSVLLIIMFSIAFYLCMSLNRKATKAKYVNRDRKRQSSGNINKKPLTHELTENSSWSNLTTSTSDELNKIREDNSFLAQQNQQFLLANFLAKNQSLDFNSEQFDKQQNLVLGRALDNTFAGNQRKCLETHLKRRRSIGATPTPIFLPQIDGDQRSFQPNSRLENVQRSKSQSQTTIYYDQGQDPFKTVPFSYINSGYLSDGTTSQRVLLDSSNLEPTEAQMFNQAEHQNHLHSYYPNSRNEALTHSLPPENFNNSQKINRIRQQELMNEQMNWSIPKPTFIATKKLDDIDNNQHHQQEQEVSSQFDPQNSRQLIDLIKNKHRKQIEQANRTASTMISSELMNQVQRQQPILAQQQRTKPISTHQSNIWR